ncbi:hypothetical protein [Comamonas sp. 17RB]|uniref:hypothetical protein n=1 Tax=Comamonas sp. 17RB TaxID=3047025 RepID=UPI0024B6BADE|nr:hypothetical protein [Comamonas sp. 17RB]MDI9854653.1 hypothetical protein [Comamonas sp. 17RB]
MLASPCGAALPGWVSSSAQRVFIHAPILFLMVRQVLDENQTLRTNLVSLSIFRTNPKHFHPTPGAPRTHTRHTAAAS